MEYREFGTEQVDAVADIYREENWMAYLREPERLKQAFRHSLYVLGAFDKDRLIGFVRCVGDGEHVVLVQDLIVRRAYRKRGIGSTLFRAAWERYGKVRMFQVVTDLSDEAANRFYRFFGMKKPEDEEMTVYFR